MSSPPATIPMSTHGDSGFLAVLMLETRVPRPLGDLGNPASFAVPVRRIFLKGAWPAKVVQTAASMRHHRLLAPLSAMLLQVERSGARAITSTCGFLILLQRELQAVVSVPLLCSGLALLPDMLRAAPRVGVLTLESARLTAEHLRAAGVARERLADVVVQGVDADGEFGRVLLRDLPQMDLARARDDVVRAALALKERAPGLTAVLLECPGMPPYARAIEAATGFACVSLLQASPLLRPFELDGVPEFPEVPV